MEELLKKIKFGDEQAFETIVKTYEKQLLVIAELRIGDAYLAKDAVQETFLSLYLNSWKIKNSSKLKSWLAIVLVSKCNNILENNKFAQISLEANELENFIYSEDEFENVVENLDFKKYISCLDIDERTIIAMYYDDNYNTKEISNILHISQGTIKSKISRAKIKLKNRTRGEISE